MNTKTTLTFSLITLVLLTPNGLTASTNDRPFKAVWSNFVDNTGPSLIAFIGAASMLKWCDQTEEGPRLALQKYLGKFAMAGALDQACASWRAPQNGTTNKFCYGFLSPTQIVQAAVTAFHLTANELGNQNIGPVNTVFEFFGARRKDEEKRPLTEVIDKAGINSLTWGTALNLGTVTKLYTHRSDNAA